MDIKQCWRLFDELPADMASDSVDAQSVDATLRLLLQLIDTKYDEPTSVQDKSEFLLKLQLCLQRNIPIVETQREVVAEQITELNTRRKMNQHYLKNV